MSPPADRDERRPKTPPAGVRSQIAGPLAKPRAGTPVEGIAFDRETTGVNVPIPAREETAMQRMQRQSAEIKNMNIGQSEELARLREQQDRTIDMLIGQKKSDIEARREFFVKLGAVVLAGALALIALLKAGCG